MEQLGTSLRGSKILVLEPCSQPWLITKDMDDFSFWIKAFKDRKNSYTFYSGDRHPITVESVQELVKCQEYGVIVIDTHGDPKYGVRLNPINPKLQVQNETSHHWLNAETIPSLDLKNTIVITLGCETAGFAKHFLAQGALAVIAADGKPDADEIYNIGAKICVKFLESQLDVKQLEKILESAKQQWEDGKYNCFCLFKN